MIYLKLPIYAYQANMMGNYHCAGFPSMTAIDGMVQSLETELSQFDQSIVFEKWSVIAQRADMKRSHKRFSYANSTGLDGNGGDKKITPSTVDEKSGDLDITLIIAIRTDENEAYFNHLRNNEYFQSAFLKLRLAGGVTTIYTQPLSPTYSGRAIEFFGSYKDALKTINRQAFLIEDKTELLPSYARVDEAPIETLFRLVRRKKSYIAPEDKALLEQELSDKPDGFFVPLAVGYYGLETPSLKHGLRDPKTPHCYVEPIVGLARLRKVGSVIYHLSLEDSEENIYPFWENSKLTENDTISNQKNLYALVGTL